MPAPSQTILIVEDDSVVRILFREILEGAGYCVEEAVDGHQALVFLAGPPPDLIILDVMMPFLDGYEVCARLKTEGSGLEEIPVIFVTALRAETDKARCLALGAVDFLAKPIAMEPFLATIKKHLPPQ